VVLLALGACSPSEDTGQPGETTTTTEDGATTTTESGSATATTAPAVVTTTTVEARTADLDCLDFWSEEHVMSVAGAEYTFTEMAADGTTCAFTAVPNSVGVYFRDGSRDDFDQAKSGASLTGEVTDLDGSCDAAWYTDLGGIVIAEGLSLGQGKIFNATLTGIADPVAAALELLDIACTGPAFTD
jgi:hypothetical protein